MKCAVLSLFEEFPKCSVEAPASVPPDWRVEAKANGWRMALYVDHDGRASALTRGLDRLPVLPDGFASLPPGTLAWAEAWHPGEPARKPRPDCRLTLIAVPYVGGEFTGGSWAAQDGAIEALLKAAPRLEPPSTRLPVDGEYPSPSELLAEAAAAGEEGWVLKSLPYAGWIKLKPTPTARLRVVEIVPGKTGRRLGGVGSLGCATEDGVRCADVSGMTEEQRAAIGPSDVGRVCEVAFQYVGSRGGLIHPRFVRWRDDCASAATWAEVAGNKKERHV